MYTYIFTGFEIVAIELLKSYLLAHSLQAQYNEK